MSPRETSKKRSLYSKIVLAAYVLHLATPILVLMDIGFAWQGVGTATDDLKAVGVGAIVWLLIGTLLLLRQPWRQAVIMRAGKPLVSFWLFVLMVAAFEIGYRVIVPPSSHELVLSTPSTVSVVKTDPLTMPGILRDAKVSMNEIGLRGTPVPSARTHFRIITIGGSTTSCSLLDDSTEWPHVLMEEMNNSGKGARLVWVGNAGLNGQSTVHHLALLKSLPILKHADLLLFLTGANDMQASLARRNESSQSMLERDAAVRSAELGDGDFHNPWIRKLRLYQMLRQSLISIDNSNTPSSQGAVTWLRNMRTQRAQGGRVALPSLATPLSEYSRRLVSLADACRNINARCAFVTQPSLYRPDLSRSEEAMLWGGWVGPVEHPDGYVSAGDAAKAIAAYNQTLLGVCKEKSLECYDLAKVIPASTDTFYDDFHFNEQGAREAADFLADHLLASPPFCFFCNQPPVIGNTLNK